MNRKRALLIAALLGCFLTGCVVGGVVVFFRAVVPMGEMLGLSSLSRTGSEAYVKYRYASYAVAKAALLEYAEQVSSTPVREGVLGEAGSSLDLGLTYGRLAVAAERAGQAPEADHYMGLATQVYAKRGQQVTPARVRAAVEQLDAAWDRRLAGATQESQ